VPHDMIIEFGNNSRHLGPMNTRHNTLD